MLADLVVLLLSAVAMTVYTPDVGVTASSFSGEKYAPARAVDGNHGTRWATADRAALPQWLELRLPEPSKVDTVVITIPIDNLYASWKEVELSFSQGESLRHTFEKGETCAELRFEPRETDVVRITVLSVHEAKNYVGINEVLVALDPEKELMRGGKTERPTERSELVIRGNKKHPCVNFTPEDMRRARERVEKHDWARKERDKIIAQADEWLRESDEYWLSFLPEPGACYAYGFTGCPICNSGTGTWANAYCSWDNPGHVKCANGHVLPDEDHPDDGQGYPAPDGRIHYFAGQFNAWVTEQWTLKALPNLAQAYALTGDERYAERGALFLEALASIYAESTSGSWDYPSDPPSGRFARPWYQVARTLVHYADYYDLLHNSRALDKPSMRPDMSRRENIEKYMLENGAYYCYKHSFHGALHNGHADYMRGALAVGCLLDIPEYVRIAVEGPFSIHAMLANNIDRDGRYYETALGYAIHARNLYLTFADPLYNIRSAEYPEGVNLYDDPKFESCLLLPQLQVMVAGRMPNFGDAGPDVAFKPYPERPFSATDYAFLEKLYARTSDEGKRRAYSAALGWLADGQLDKLRDGAGCRNWLMWHAGDTTQVEPALPEELEPRITGSWVAGMKGMAILRGGEQAVLVRFGPSLNHGDPDDLALLYYANGREWTYDIGYGLGSTHTHVGWASSTVSHCLVTVNEKNQLGGEGSGGSLHFVADLPSVKVAQAASENSYSAEGVTKYQRTVALVDGAYLLDVFDVAGGHQHDFGFGSIGDDLTPFGVPDLKPQEGSLAEGYAWGEMILPDGDIQGHPSKPYWNPPPGNGYGFFYNVRRGQPEGIWGGTWTIDGDLPAPFRVHVAGDPAEAIFATAPGLYPSKPLSSYLIARREGENLASTFVAAYDPFKTSGRRFDFGYADLAHNMIDSSAETKVMDAYGAVLLKGTKPGDAMTVRLDLDDEAETTQTLLVYCLQAPSYGALQVEWDGEPVGGPVNLNTPTVQGPTPFEIGEVDTSPGEHTITFRVAEGDAFYAGISGLQFGALGSAEPKPVIDSVNRTGSRAVEIRRTSGVVDVLLVGSANVECAYGHVEFDGDFAYLTSDGAALSEVEVVGCAMLRVGDEVLDEGPAAFSAIIKEVDFEARAVTLDQEVPGNVNGLVAVFSNPAYSRTTAYHVLRAEDRRIELQASTLTLGKGRVQAITGPKTFTSEIPHEYAKSVRRAHSTLFFDGKRIQGEHGGATRIIATKPGSPLQLTVQDAAALAPGEAFKYQDLAPGDAVRIAFLRTRSF